MSGKGSAPRPFAVSDDVYSANWALVFGPQLGGEQSYSDPEKKDGDEGNAETVHRDRD